MIENDPLNDVEVLSDWASDICSLLLENAKDMESHVNGVKAGLRWDMEIKNHIGSKLCPNLTKLLGK